MTARSRHRPRPAVFGALVLALVLHAGGSWARDAVADADPAFEARVQAVAAELRCLVCQNQSLADSHAELALDLKNQVREQLLAGRTEAQVVEYMTDRYGDFVRYRPAFKGLTLLLWSGPLLLLLAGGWAMHRAIRPLRRAQDLADAASTSAGDPGTNPRLAQVRQLLVEAAPADTTARRLGDQLARQDTPASR